MRGLIDLIKPDGIIVLIDYYSSFHCCSWIHTWRSHSFYEPLALSIVYEHLLLILITTLLRYSNNSFAMNGGDWFIKISESYWLLSLASHSVIAFLTSCSIERILWIRTCTPSPVCMAPKGFRIISITSIDLPMLSSKIYESSHPAVHKLQKIRRLHTAQAFMGRVGGGEFEA